MNVLNTKTNIIRAALSLLVIGFGLMTIKSGGFALFGGEEGKVFAGKYVWFVLWFNFIAGFFYVITGIGLIIKKEWSWTFSGIIALLTMLVFAMFGVSILLGAEFEIRTVAAMTVRSSFWIAIYFIVKKLK